MTLKQFQLIYPNYIESKSQLLKQEHCGQDVKVEPKMEIDNELDMMKAKSDSCRQGVETKDIAVQTVQFSYLQLTKGTGTIYHCNGIYHNINVHSQ